MTRQRFTTQDRGPPGEITIHTVEQLGPNQSRLPNGSLLCSNVPVARVGWLLYGPHEVPVEVGDSGVAYVERLEEDLFNEKTIASFQAAAVTDDHPDDDVNPSNWRQLAVGFALNVRRGEGADSDVLFADLMITNKDAIKAIQDGKREVSAGYDADYEDKGHGIGRQFNIIGNHIALVARGRCGPRCAIGDEAYDVQHEENEMATQRVKVRGSARRVTVDSTALLAARKRFADAEMELHEAEQNAMEQSSGGSGGEFSDSDGSDQHIHIHIGEDPTVPVNDSLKRMRDCPDGSEGGEGMQAFPKNEDDPDNPNPETDDDANGDDPVQALHAKVDALAEQVAQLLAKFGTPKDDGNEDNDPDGTQDDLTDGPESATPRDDDSTAVKDDLEDLINKEEKEANTNGTAPTKDSAALQRSYASMLSMAEVLVPGFRMPTFDSKLTRKITIDSMCTTRRKVLDIVYATTDGQALLQGVSGDKSLQLASLSCADCAVMFKAAAGAKALLNNAKSTKDSQHVTEQEPERPPGPMTIAEINRANAAYWEKHQTMIQ